MGIERWIEIETVRSFFRLLSLRVDHYTYLIWKRSENRALGLDVGIQRVLVENKGLSKCCNC